jgi:hypothetical protein
MSTPSFLVDRNKGKYESQANMAILLIAWVEKLINISRNIISCFLYHMAKLKLVKLTINHF